MKRLNVDIVFWNKILRDQAPEKIINWALQLTDNRIVTTSFGVYSSVLLSTISKMDPDIKVVWCDTLFNTPETYNHAKTLIEKLKLNIKTYRALLSKSEIEQQIGLPSIEDDNFEQFSEVVKLEPFRRALNEIKPDLWFTNIRVRQTEFRDKKDILSWSKDGILKVSPFYYWSDADLDAYVKSKNLPKNDAYFDPVKALKNRECGIHFQ